MEWPCSHLIMTRKLQKHEACKGWWDCFHILGCVYLFFLIHRYYYIVFNFAHKPKFQEKEKVLIKIVTHSGNDTFYIKISLCWSSDLSPTIRFLNSSLWEILSKWAYAWDFCFFGLAFFLEFTPNNFYTVNTHISNDLHVQ